MSETRQPGAEWLAIGTVQRTMNLIPKLAVFCTLTASLCAQVVTQSVLDQYCLGCHNSTVSSGGLALDRFDASVPGENPQVWESVVRKLTHRHMPPQGLPRPDEATYDALVIALSQSLDDHAENHPNAGRERVFRRLNRTEYGNAIRDLLALDVDVRSLLPRDDSSHGFDNITGEVSPTLLERFLAAARKISRLAIGTPPRAVGGELIVVPVDLTQEARFSELPFGTRGGIAARHTFPADGDYEIRITLSRDRNEQVEGLYEAHELELTLDGRQVRRFTVTPPEQRDHRNVDRHLVARVPVRAGPREIGTTFLAKSSALIEAQRQPYLARFNMDRHPRTQPAVYSIAIVGPHDPTGPGDTPSRRRIFSCHPDSASAEDQCAEQILSRLARRAYRRPVTADDIEKPLEFFRQGLERDGFEAGIETALRALLVSPEFLLRGERDKVDGTGRPYRVSQLELASRLSFFLWSSIPDEELLAAAERGALDDQGSLERQVLRMLRDSRSQALVESFAGQWLYLRNLASLTPDRRLFPDFDENLRRAFRRETELLFETVLREDRSVVELLAADYTFLNERLAKHYGIPHVYGDHFRRVELDPNGVRGGLLSHGSILAVTSYANRTSPVLRGKWVLANILGTPPRPPPPEIPDLAERTHWEEPRTLRERITEHREDPACAACHDIIDPLGFAFENFDAVGRWRTHDEGVLVDASGRLPDGTEFSGPHGLREALLDRPDLFVSTVAEKLLTYALGRGLEHYDAPAIRKIVRDSMQQDYRFSSLVLGVVRSTPFRMRNPR